MSTSGHTRLRNATTWPPVNPGLFNPSSFHSFTTCDSDRFGSPPPAPREHDGVERPTLTSPVLMTTLTQTLWLSLRRLFICELIQEGSAAGRSLSSLPISILIGHMVLRAFG